MVFAWLKCLECEKDYVALPSPLTPGGWFFFEAHNCDLEHPSHYCSGAFLCVNGHSLNLVAPAVVLNARGQWLRLENAQVYNQVN